MIFQLLGIGSKCESDPKIIEPYSYSQVQMLTNF